MKTLLGKVSTMFWANTLFDLIQNKHKMPQRRPKQWHSRVFLILCTLWHGCVMSWAMRVLTPCWHVLLFTNIYSAIVACDSSGPCYKEPIRTKQNWTGNSDTEHCADHQIRKTKLQNMWRNFHSTTICCRTNQKSKRITCTIQCTLASQAWWISQARGETPILTFYL